MKLKVAILISSLSLMMIAFVNCTGVSQEMAFSNEKTKASSEPETESGQPYDGKVYVVASSSCQDGIEIKSRIVFTSPSAAKLDRDNCEYISPLTLNPQEIQINPADSTQLSFRNETFKEAAPLALGITNFLASADLSSFTYSFNYSGNPTYLQVLLDTDNSFSTGYNYSGDVGADYLLENGDLFIYSGQGGAWGWTRIGSATLVKAGGNVKWTISRTAIGSPAKINAKARTSLGYSSGVVSQ